MVTQIKALEAPDQRPARRARRPAHLHQPAPLGLRVQAARLLAEIGDCRAKFPTPEALICLAGVAPSTRQSRKDPRRGVPMGLRQTTPRRRLRLRRRLDQGQSLGSRSLPKSQSTRSRPPTPSGSGPCLADRHLALLAGRRALRPRRTPGPATPPQPRSKKGDDTGLLIASPGTCWRPRRRSGRSAGSTR
ncbi:MAG: transposase [Nakamurella multipartita]